MDALPHWTPECECSPGTEFNGWHERRCRHCRKLESAIWREVMRNFHAEEYYD